MTFKLRLRHIVCFFLLAGLSAAAAAGYALYKKNISLALGEPPPPHEIAAYLSAAEGYEIAVFAAPDAPVRQLAVGPDGWLFAGSRGDKVFALKDDDGDHIADRQVTIAADLNRPHGVAYHDGDLYIGAVPAVYRLDNIMAWLESDAAAQAPRTDLQTFIADGLVSSAHHGMRHIKTAGDYLYVALGVPCNICIPPSADFTGVIRRYALSGEDDGEVYARGIRNAVGFDFHPVSGALWFTDNGRDWLGDELPHDELNRVSAAGEDFGYPFCHQGDLIDPEYGQAGDCDAPTAPQLLTGAHVANLGMAFNEDGSRAYIALHGSWNSSVKVGYALHQAVISDDEKVTGYAPFVTGWLQPGDKVLGRPADVARAADGALFVSDDFAGVIYRISKAR